MKKLLLLISLSACFTTYSQTPADSSATDINALMDMLDKEQPKIKTPVTATFKSSRIINGHSVELVKPKHLDFRLSHRFSSVRDGLNGFFGLDNASTRMALEYGINKYVMVGVGRSGAYGKSVDGFVKGIVLQQKENGMPVTVALLLASAINTVKNTDPDFPFSWRLSYTYQALIASKISDRVSLQLMPTLVHRNLVPTTKYPNDLFALGIGGRLKLSQRIALTAEYYYRFLTPQYRSVDPYFNSLSVGIDIDTGGHIFALHFTNSRAQIENGFIGETTYNWLKGDFCFGFNITRQFYVGKKGGKTGW